MRYSHAIAITMISAFAAGPAMAENNPTTASGSQSAYNQSAANGQSGSFGAATRGYVVSDPDIHAFSGPRVEVRADWSSLTGSSASNGGYGGYCGGYACGYSQGLSNNINLGGEVGYDVPISSSFTVGPYGKFTTNVSTSSGCVACGGNDYSLGIRAGVMASRRFLVYGKIGYNSLESTINYTIVPSAPGQSANASTNFKYTGAEFGLGMNYIFSKKSYIGLELMDANYGNGDPYYNGNQRIDIGLTLGIHL
jgi:hypothetical protein